MGLIRAELRTARLPQFAPFEVSQFPEPPRSTGKPGGLTRHWAVLGEVAREKPDAENAVLGRPLVAIRQLYRPPGRF